MTALDRIRLTGLLRKDPAPAGSFYVRGVVAGDGTALAVLAAGGVAGPIRRR